MHSASFRQTKKWGELMEAVRMSWTRHGEESKDAKNCSVSYFKHILKHVSALQFAVNWSWTLLVTLFPLSLVQVKLSKMLTKWRRRRCRMKWKYLWLYNPHIAASEWRRCLAIPVAISALEFWHLKPHTKARIHACPCQQWYARSQFLINVFLFVMCFLACFRDRGRENIMRKD